MFWELFRAKVQYPEPRTASHPVPDPGYADAFCAHAPTSIKRPDLPQLEVQAILDTFPSRFQPVAD